jgi:hypothetical protein
VCLEAINTNFIIFGLTRSVLEPTIFCTRGEYANHYTTDTVSLWFDFKSNVMRMEIKIQVSLSKSGDRQLIV